MKPAAKLGFSTSKVATLPLDNAALVVKLAEKVDRLSGQVAALLAVIVTQPATNFSSIGDAKRFIMSLSVDKLNPAPGGLSPLDHAIATIDRIASQGAAVVTHDPGD
jgi:hypothetical protein